MSGKLLKKLTLSPFALAGISLMTLAGCDENGEFQLPFGNGTDANPSEAGTSITGPNVRLVERDVEAPEVFSVQDNGLWDGRPSLGGVWVAHPDVDDPERVKITNTSNGEIVIGALFRRERENPGPSLQVSSDAAEALGILAGSPAPLSVVALRREEAPEEATSVEEAETELLGAPPVVEATTLDGAEPVEIAAAELDVVEAPLPSAPAAPSADPITGAAAIAIAAAAAAAENNQTAAPAPAPAPTPTPAPAASTLDKPYIQIGIFSVEANAEETARKLRSDGLLSNVVKQESQGRTFWRVTVGPAPTTSDRAAILSKAKALGFNDSYFVSN